MNTDNIEVFTQSSIRIRSAEGTVYFDPFKMNSAPHDADYIFITHDHYDHFSPADIAKVAKEDTILVIPQSMAGKVKEVESLVGAVGTVVPGGAGMMGQIPYEAIPAYNKIKPFHPKRSGFVGYIVTLDGMRIYVAGDTDMTKENKEVRCDIALVPIGGKFTMDPKEAAQLVNQIHPLAAIPTHYGSIVGKVSDGELFASLVDDGIEVEIKIRQ